MKTFVGKVRGIKYYFASNNIYSYKNYDFLKLVPDPYNEYDSDAVKIVDIADNHIGFVSSDDNRFVKDLISKYDYFCYITHVYYDLETPSIEYTIFFKDKDEINSKFDYYLTQYKEVISSDKDSDIDDIFDDIKVKKVKTKKADAEIKEKLVEGVKFLRDGFYEEAFLILEPLANTYENEHALFFCGHMLFKGQGVARDFQKSFDYFSLAKEKGFKPISFEIGRFYEYGIVVEKDIKKAISLYEKAAYEERSFEALNRLASMYFTGIGLPPDIDKFFECVSLVEKYNEEIEKEIRSR